MEERREVDNIKNNDNNIKVTITMVTLLCNNELVIMTARVMIMKTNLKIIRFIYDNDNNNSVKDVNIMILFIFLTVIRMQPNIMLMMRIRMKTT